MAVGGAVAAFAAPSHAPAAQPMPQPQPQCTLRLPDQPLTAQGLATPFVLSGVGGQACHESDPGTAAFAQGIVLDPATGHLSVYDPLVIDEGTQPAVAPTVPTLPPNAIVALWFGFNDNVLELTGPGVQAASCVNGSGNSLFGQFSYCNAPAFFTAANAAVAQGRITIPPIGTAADGSPCLTTRDFGLVDQDQSDNVTTTYLALPDGRTAQNTEAAAKKLAGKSAAVLANASDNLLLDHFVDPALGCTPFTAPDLANPGFQATSLALDELQAAADQSAPVALVPLSDPMTLDDSGATSDTKTDLYRAGVDQPPLSQVSGSPAQYCANLRTIGVNRTKLDRHLTDTTSSPDSGAASNLFTFLAMRLQQSYVNLGCQRLLGKNNPVHLKTDGNGVVVDATFDRVGSSPSPSPSPSPSASPSPSPSATTASGSSASSSPSTVASPSTHPTTVTPSHAPSSPPPSPSSPSPTTAVASSTTPTQQPSGNDDSKPSAVAVMPSSTSKTSAPAVPKQPAQPTQPVASKSSTSAAAAPGGNGGSGSGGNGANGNGGSGAAVASKPVAAVTSTPISVAGFEHAHASASANPNSALSGPDPMANSGFDIMSSRVFWALAGSLLVLGVSMLYRRRPRQPRQSRRGVSS